MLVVPNHLQKNHPNIAKLGYENTGLFILNQIANKTHKVNLIDCDLLDVGCGVRFAATIINKNIPIKSYTGLDVDDKVVQFLQNNVKDSRFKFFHINCQNIFYNPSGVDSNEFQTLPVPSNTYDVACMFSVITHQNPTDTSNLFKLCKKHVQKNGYMVFSAFVEPNIQSFVDAIPNKPLLQAHYSPQYLTDLLFEAGWYVEQVYPPDKQKIIQSLFVCKHR